MALPPDRGQVRLAELVAALSLGIDLGFGQPMEHVLRQCLIALRLAERLGVDDETRGVVYYTGLLVNVGCHTDAHEQAKWFGDDIALRAGKYRHEPRSVRAVTSSLRRLGAGNPPLHRLRVGLAFAGSGHRELDAMFAHHAAMAARLADELQLPAGVSSGLLARVRDLGRPGLAERVAGDEIPIAARIVQLAEHVEVAHRVGGIESARALARRRAGTQFDPALVALLATDPAAILDDLDSIDRWATVIESEPALAVTISGARFDAALEAVAAYVDLKSPYFLGHSQAVAELASTRRSASGWPPKTSVRFVVRDLSTTTAGSASRTRSGTRPALSVQASGSASACTRTSRDGCCARPPCSHRSARSPRSTASGSTARATRVATRLRPSRARRASWPRLTRTRRCASRARTAPSARPRRPRPFCGRRSGQADSTLTRSMPCCGRSVTACRAVARGRPD